jgi:hypothetical protein
VTGSGAQPIVRHAAKAVGGPRTTVWVLLAAWALLLAAWVVGNPPFAAPDEAQHFVRAVAMSEGHLIGRPDAGASVGANAAQVAWNAQLARLVSLPAGFDPAAYGCELGPGAPSAACLNAVSPHPPAATLTNVPGDFQPMPYLLPAAVLRAASSPAGALRLARAATAVLTLALLAIAAFALYDAGSPRLSLLGLVLAVTPMVLFLGASLTGSATEVAGGIAFFACLLRLARARSPARRWWALAAVSGAVLALSRSTSPAWVVLALAVALAWIGPREVLRRWGRERAPWLVGGVLAAAVAVNRLWEALYGAHVPLDFSQLHAGLVAGVRVWWTALPELVGKFGYLDVKLPVAVPAIWLGLVAILLAAAAAVCTPRQRVVLGVVVLAALAGPVLFYAIVLRPTGYPLQGRHILPIVAAVPLLGGEMLLRHRTRVDPRLLGRVTVVALVAVAIMQPLAWYVNAKRYAVGGSGPVWFLGSAAWSPPGGWWPWLVAVVLAGCCIAASALGGMGGGEAPA